MRLDRILANSGLGSRTEVKNFIRKGRISLNGEVLRSGKIQIKDEEKHLLQFDQKPLDISKYLYFVMHKPKSHVTSMNPNDDDAIYHLLPDYFLDKKIMPVGRLDKDTTGVLLFTNNGELNHRLLSPKYKIPRKYKVEVEVLDHGFTIEDKNILAKGIKLNEFEKAAPCELEIISETIAYLTLYEGKYHEVKRIMHAIGKEVINLHRENFGPILVKDMQEGNIEKLSKSQVIKLFELTKLNKNDL